MLSTVIHSILSYPALLLAQQLAHQRYVHPGPLVLRTTPLNLLTPTADRNRTVSQRSEPSSRTTLIGEQPNPWDVLPPRDVMSRHRGAKPPRRYELLGEISLLSPAYLLFVDRWPFHTETTGSLWPTFVSARSVFLAVKQAFAIALINWFQPVWAYRRTPPLLFRRRPSQSNYPPCSVLTLDS